MVRVTKKKYYFLFIILILAILYTYLLRYKPPHDNTLPPLDKISYSISNYIGSDEYQPPGSLKMLGADTTLFRSYNNEEGGTIWLFIGYFGSQQENSQIHSPKHCYPGSGWNIVREGNTLLTNRGKKITAKFLLITNQTERRLVVYWFHTKSGTLTDEFALKWFQMKSSLMRKPQSAAFIRFSTTIPANRKMEEILRELSSFIQAVTPEIDDIIQLRQQINPSAEPLIPTAEEQFSISTRRSNYCVCNTFA
jgi:EpsI family protein